jgi:hypothetical protein
MTSGIQLAKITDSLVFAASIVRSVREEVAQTIYLYTSVAIVWLDIYSLAMATEYYHLDQTHHLGISPTPPAALICESSAFP